MTTISKRIATAAVGIPVVLGVVVYGGHAAFFVLAAAILLAGLWEFLSMTIPDGSLQARLTGLGLGGVLLAAAYYDASTDEIALLPGACALSFGAVFWQYMSRHSAQMRTEAMRAMAQLCGIVYIPFLGSYLILLRALPSGVALVMLLLTAAWAGDSAAFAVGTLLGRHRLSTRISPKKTIEGAGASLAAAILTTVVFKVLWLGEVPLGHCIAIGLGLNIANQFGDLCESFIKRATGVKDSGTLFPGHGGVLDRIDSLLFAAPFLFYYTHCILHL